MSKTTKLTKSLIVLEDLAQGPEPVSQVRNGQTITGTPITAQTLPYAGEDDQTMAEALAAALALKLDKASIAQEAGEGKDLVMSQKAVTDAISEVLETLTKTFTPWQPEVIEGTGSPANFTTIPDLSFGGGYSQNENVFTFSPIEEEDGYWATWKANVENVPEKYSITYNKVSTDPNAPVLGYYSGVAIGDFDPANDIYPTVAFNYSESDDNDPALLIVDNYTGDSIVDPAKTLMNADGQGAITAQPPGQGVDVTLAIDNSALSVSIFYDGEFKGAVYLLEPLIPESIWVSTMGLVSGVGETATVTLVDRVVEDYIPFTIYGFGTGGYAIDETKYPQNPEGNGYEIIGLAQPTLWNELGKKVKNGDFIVFDNAGLPKEIGGGGGGGGGEVDLSDYTQRAADETITGDWDFQGEMKVGDYTYNTMFGPYHIEKIITYAHPGLSSPMNIAYGIDTGYSFSSMAVAFNIDDLSLGQSILTELFTEENSVTGGHTGLYSVTAKENDGTVEKSMVIEAYADGSVSASIGVASRSDGTAHLTLNAGNEPVDGLYASNILTDVGGITIKEALDSKADKDQANLWHPERVLGALVTSKWTTRTAVDGGWFSVTWSPELGIFVAVATTGTDRVMTSPDGINWTARTAATSGWVSVTWSPELGIFVAVATTGTNQVMTSPDGINWTDRTAAAGDWRSVTWSPELGIFVAVARSGTDRVMTSPDGINWTARTAVDSYWVSVTWSPELGIFVAVADNGTDRVMTSPDGINWTARTAAASQWCSVTWSPELGIFVAVATTGTDRVMTSPDGINWTARTAADGGWQSVTWSPELGIFVAVARSGTDRVMTSPDGINWTARTTAASPWSSVTWSPELGIFVAVTTSGTDRVMTSWTPS